MAKPRQMKEMERLVTIGDLYPIAQELIRRIDYLNAAVYDLREQRGWRGVRNQVAGLYRKAAVQVNALYSRFANAEPKEAEAGDEVAVNQQG